MSCDITCMWMIAYFVLRHEESIQQHREEWKFCNPAKRKEKFMFNSSCPWYYHASIRIIFNTISEFLCNSVLMLLSPGQLYWNDWLFLSFFAVTFMGSLADNISQMLRVWPEFFIMIINQYGKTVSMKTPSRLSSISICVPYFSSPSPQQK